MKTALLVIDYINGIMNNVCRDYASKHPIVKNTNKLIAHCRAKNIPIYFVRLGFDKNYSNMPKHSNIFNFLKKMVHVRLAILTLNLLLSLILNLATRLLTKQPSAHFIVLV